MNKEEEHDNKPSGKRKIKQCSDEEPLPIEIAKKSKDSGPLDATYYDLPPVSLYCINVFIYSYNFYNIG